ncbi:MAG: glycosyltransferase family 2 protein [Sphingobacterium sp.]|jgi:glycosyltransferase involved in cell wall biosynthesis|nr:glycosyltransferase family 2 protein [Sphingobacterium sp.]
MRLSKVAIVIPAYKSEYLTSTLQSLSNQTNQDFTIYIGDDCSPYDLKSIVNEFSGQLDIVYHRFEDNLGSISLTRQWERCIDLTIEEWIWLFSDDDIVAENAVQVFYEVYDPQSLLYKFNTQVIDASGSLHSSYSKFDHLNLGQITLNSDDFIKNRLACKGYRSFAVEYIFHRSLYEKFKFVDFPLAWGSDDATWLLYSLNNKKKFTILPANVYWRYSGINISSDLKTLAVVEQKLEAAKQYIEWVRGTSSQYQVEVSDDLLLRWLSVQAGSLSPKMHYNDFKKLTESAGISHSSFKLWLSYVWTIKKNLFISILKGKK